MISVLVTGKNSQLAQCLIAIENSCPNILFSYFDSKSLDITNLDSLEEKFQKHQYNYCINCAAYTAVDKAEVEPEKAKAVNTTGALQLAKVCKKHNTTLIHISTDFVFDGIKNSPYTEDDDTNPINVYGKTKREGEIKIVNTLSNYFIIRTSWLYSEYGNNFVKTILRLSQEKDEINVVDDQKGSPTYAGDLAKAIVTIINSQSKNFGVYHYSNLGDASWYDFAKEIVKLYNLKLHINPIASANYKTNALRPNYSVMNTLKFQNNFKTKLSHWQTSLNSLSNIN